jgi:MFS family permease
VFFLKKFISLYDAAIWIRIIGTALTTGADYMIRPFMVLYLHEKLDSSILLTMLIVGLQPLVAVIITLWGGGLSDKYGRKPLMLIALITNTITMAGYMFANSIWEFAILSMLNGFGTSLLGPAANAQIADIVPEGKRAEVFATLHTALNIGAAVGPILGMVVFNQNPKLVFGLAAFAFFIYTCLVYWNIQETLPANTEKESISKFREIRSLKVTQHKFLFLITLLTIPLSILYSQIDTVLPLHMKENFTNYIFVISIMLSVNATAVMLFQIWISKRTEHLRSFDVVLISYVLLSIVALAYGYSPFLILLIMSELLFSLGEMLIWPHMQKIISILAPEDMRGRYFSIFGLHWQISRVLGPLIFGFVFEQWGGQTVFGLIALIIGLAGIVQYWLIKKITSVVKMEKPKIEPTLSS